MEKGYIQVYTGDGKGKTTAALGLAMRAVGRGLRVIMFQFLKGSGSGELETAKRLAPEFEIRRFSRPGKFAWQLTNEEKESLRQDSLRLCREVMDCMVAGTYDLIILDEIMGAIHYGLLAMEEVCRLVDTKPAGVELVLTGRDAPEEIVKRADLVTEMKAVKHYLSQGVPARIGIEK